MQQRLATAAAMSIRPTVEGAWSRGCRIDDSVAAAARPWHGWRRQERQPIGLSCVRRCLLVSGLARADSHPPTNLSRKCHSRERCHPPVALPVAEWHTRTGQAHTRFWTAHSTPGAGVQKNEKNWDERRSAAVPRRVAVQRRGRPSTGSRGCSERSRDRATDTHPPTLEMSEKL